MSLPDMPRRRRVSARHLLALALPLLAPAAGCSVAPLYSSQAEMAGGQAGLVADLRSIAIKPVETRYAQEVRNHLIFAFGGGEGQPVAPKYTLTLSVRALNQSAALVQVAKENEPTAGTVTMFGSYVLTDNETGKAVADGSRNIPASYDVPRQEFAAIRAQRDAENRAARELAELLKLAIAQDLAGR